MKERPILFSGPMVRALLSGQKTQTRRAVKGQALEWLEEAGFTPAFVADPGNSLCPYGQVGDRLWVRETWHAEAVYDGDPPREIEFDACCVLYAADERWSDRDQMTRAGRTRSPLHMPRWASRLTLQITDIRVERLQDISEADAQAEGVRRRVGSEGPNLFTIDIDNFSANAPTASEVYRMLWETINGDGTWSANPWVWAITFEVVK